MRFSTLLIKHCPKKDLPALNAAIRRGKNINNMTNADFKIIAKVVSQSKCRILKEMHDDFIDLFN